MKKFITTIFGIMVINFSCFNQHNLSEIKNNTIDKVVNKIFSDFASNVKLSKLIMTEMNFNIDTIVEEKLFRNEIQNSFFNDKPLYNLENISFVVSKDIVKRNLNKNFLKANVIFSDDATYKISDYHLRNDLIRNKNSILFKYSNIFKTKNKNEYFFSFIYICGRLCGGQYFICFNLDKDGNLNEYSIRFVEA